MIHRRGFLRKLPLEQAYSRQTVYLLGNGSTGYTSVMEVLPETQTVEVNENQLQPADYGPDKMSLNARITMLKMYRRRVGGRIPDFELLEAKSLYRPFWLVYYGEPKNNGRRLCSVRAADGFTVGKFG